MTDDVKTLWEAYWRDRSDHNRNRLVVTYAPLVRHVAERIHKGLPCDVELDDLCSAGVFGLVEAIKCYDASRRVKFEHYCGIRIRGAILDELRAMDWVPRLVRSRSSRMGRASASLKATLGRPPTDRELSIKLNAHNGAFQRIKRDSSAAGVSSLSRKYFSTDSNKDVCEIDVLKDDRQISPFVEAQCDSLKSLLVKGLTRVQRLLVILYYFDQMTMKEIGPVLGLSESRVSQMHTEIVNIWKATIKKSVLLDMML